MNLKDIKGLKDVINITNNLKVEGSTDFIFIEIDSKRKIKYKFLNYPMDTTENIVMDLINLINNLNEQLSDKTRQLFKI